MELGFACVQARLSALSHTPDELWRGGALDNTPWQGIGLEEFYARVLILHRQIKHPEAPCYLFSAAHIKRPTKLLEALADSETEWIDLLNDKSTNLRDCLTEPHAAVFVLVGGKNFEGFGKPNESAWKK